jgi:hypothetical protein
MPFSIKKHVNGIIELNCEITYQTTKYYSYFHWKITTILSKWAINADLILTKEKIFLFKKSGNKVKAIQAKKEKKIDNQIWYLLTAS